MHDLLKVFPNYVELFKQVNVEYQLTPEWRVIRKQKLLNKMHRINVSYSKWFEKEMKSREKS